ncbi:hypothetical protein E3P94_01779 [Wallemia ichthyophaga]|nr:hypothetical protein E3P95_01805 [Wallemia ichthyophaga]TIB01398.1 hypothetical protein E3P94_01779 [Wallemia ichthyophaga]
MASPLTLQDILDLKGEDPLLFLLNERNTLASQNNQLWNLIDRQKSTINKLNVELDTLPHEQQQHSQSTHHLALSKKSHSHDDAINLPIKPAMLSAMEKAQLSQQHKSKSSPYMQHASHSFNTLPQARSHYQHLSPKQPAITPSVKTAAPPVPVFKLTPTLVPALQLAVLSSSVKPNKDNKSVYSFTITVKYEPSNAEWKVDKSYDSIHALDIKVREIIKKPYFKHTKGRLVSLPDKSIFKDRSPSKVLQQKTQLENYFHSIISIPHTYTIIPKNSATPHMELAAFLSSDFVRPNQASQINGTKDGYLTKKGKNLGGWKTRYFTIGREGILDYYEQRGGSQIGSIRIHDASIGRQHPSRASSDSSSANERDSAFKHAFLILERHQATQNEKDRHILCAENDLERDNWINTLLWHQRTHSNVGGASSPVLHERTNIAEDSTPNSANNGLKRRATSLKTRSLETHKLKDVERPRTSDSKPISKEEIQPSNSVSLTSLPPEVSSKFSIPKVLADARNTGKVDALGISQHGESANLLPQRQGSIHSLSGQYKAVGAKLNESCESIDKSEKQHERDHKGKSRGFWGAFSGSSSGSSKDKSAPKLPVFGVPVDDSLQQAQIAGLPAVVFRCIRYLQHVKAEEEEGIYRLSGSSTQVKGLKERYNSEGDIDLIESDDVFDPHAITGLLKLYFRELPVSLLTRELHFQFLQVADIPDPKKRVRELGRLVSLLPIANYALLRALVSHLTDVVSSEEINRMSLRNVSIVFSPTLGIPAPLFGLLLTEFKYVFNVGDGGKPVPLEDQSTEEEDNDNDNDDDNDHVDNVDSIAESLAESFVSTAKPSFETTPTEIMEDETVDVVMPAPKVNTERKRPPAPLKIPPLNAPISAPLNRTFSPPITTPTTPARPSRHRRKNRNSALYEDVDIDSILGLRPKNIHAHEMNNDRNSSSKQDNKMTFEDSDVDPAMPSERLPTSTPTKPGIFQKWDEFSIEKMFASKKRKPLPRSVYLNSPLPHESTLGKKTWTEKLLHPRSTHHVGPGWVYTTNQIISSKYTILTFVPRNILEQFRRVANLFFLGIAILQFFPKFSTINAGVVILPLIIIVFITACKDGYEDIKRHQSDRKVNHSKVKVLKGKYGESRHSDYHYHNFNHIEAKSKTFTGGLPKGAMLGKLRLKKKSKNRDHVPPPNLPDAVTSLDDELKFESDQMGRHSVGNPPELNDTGEFNGRQVGLVDDLENPRTYTPPPPPAQLPAGPIPENDAEEVEEGEEDDGQDDAGNSWRTMLWEDVKVGDFVKIHNNEPFPAGERRVQESISTLLIRVLDIVVCSTSEEEDVCFVETKNLDGETNLKSRHAIPQLSHLTSPAAIARECHGYRIDSEPADVNMFRLNAAVVKEDQQPVKCPVDMSTMLLRGTVLRNTKWVIGVVLFTGSDTKIIANSGITPSKRAKTERLMDPQVGFNLALLAIISAICAIVAYTIEVDDQRNGAYWTYNDDRPDDNPSTNGVFTFFNGLITFQNIVPISLYISMEFVRTCQAGWIYLDKEMRYKKNGYRTVARSWNLSDELGQIQYIFSDKTGTLTQNAMIFRQCSIAGKVYKADENTVVESKLSIGHSPDIPASIVDSVTPLNQTKAGSEFNSSDGHEPHVNKHTTTRGENPQETEEVPKFFSSVLQEDIRGGVNEEAEKKSQDTDAFLTCLSLCHTALAAEKEDGTLEYKAQSPDESALVQGAADIGYVFKGRDRNILKLQTPFTGDGMDHYELLNVLEFSSARKRMSVVIRKLSPKRAQMKIDMANNVARGERNPKIALDDDDEEESEIILLTKGADNIIFERCEANVHNQGMKDATDKDLSLFASEGLRTLCLGYRVVPTEVYEEFSKEYNDATVSLEDRENLIEAVASKFETNLTLLGATAIEDKLQDGVPETIRDLKRAGIKVWVATGDKLETAIAIGYSTQLLTDDNNLIIVRGGEYGDRNSAYSQMRRAMEQFFPGENIPSRLRNQPPDNHYDGGSKRSSTQSHAMSDMESLVGADNGQRDGGYALVIDGTALTHALSEPWSKDLLLNLALKCQSVVCCRVSPLQKALVVRLIKDNLDTMTLAIGDGANDVSMIQAAHVGIGIAGEEGLQAVNSSDYAIAQFRYLKKLLLVHGHWYYYRNSNAILSFWIKNINGAAVLFWYQFYCAFSTSYVYAYIYLLLWNVLWTICPPIGLGLFDSVLSDRVLMAIPELYKYGRTAQYFNHRLFFLYVFEAIVQSTIVFFFTYYAYQSPTARSDGFDVYIYEMSTTMIVSIVTGTNLLISLNARSWNWWIAFGMFFGIVLVWAFTGVYSALSPQLVWTNVWGNDYFVFHSPLFWFCVIFTVIFSLIPRYLFKAYKFQFHPDDIHIMQYVQKKDDNHDFENDPLMQSHLQNAYYEDSEYPPNRPSSARSGQRIDMRTGERSSGRNATFNFDQEENGYALQRLQSHLSETSSQFHRRPSTHDAQARKRKLKRKSKNWTSRTVDSFKTAMPTMRKTKNS